MGRRRCLGWNRLAVPVATIWIGVAWAVPAALADPVPQPSIEAPSSPAAIAAHAAEGQGDHLVRIGDLSGAAHAYSTAAAADASNPLYQITAGVALAAVGRVDGAIAAFRRAQRLAPGDAVVDLLLAGAIAERPESVAADRPGGPSPGFGGGGGFRAVQNGYAPRTAVQNNVAVGQQSQSVFFFDPASVNTGSTSSAVEARNSVVRLEAAAARFPDSPVVQMLLGDAYQLSEQWSDAEACYRRAISLAPHWSKPLVNLGLAQLAQGQPARSIQTFQQALALDPGDALANLGKGDAERTAGRTQAALDAYANVANSRNAAVAAQANAGIGQVFADRGQYTDAYRAFGRAAELDPTDPAPLAALGATQYRGGDYAGAATSYQTALQLSQSDVVSSSALLRQALAEAQLAAHDPTGAILTVQQALTAEPAAAGLWYRLWANALFDQGNAAGGEAKLKASLEADADRRPEAALRALAARGLLRAVTAEYAGELDRTVDRVDRLRLLGLLVDLSRYQGDIQSEARWRLETVRTQPTGRAWFALAISEERTGDASSARDAFTRALGFGDLSSAQRQFALARAAALAGASVAAPPAPAGASASGAGR
jgi:tetratricopeptide (TPR) repeat protein